MKYFLSISFIFLLMTFGCNKHKPDTYPASFQGESLDSGASDFVFEKISLEELPVDIKKVILEDDLFGGLNISDITKVTDNDSIYYDMTFRDVDGQLIM